MCTCQDILIKDLNMLCVSAKYVFCILTIERKEQSLYLITNLLQETEMDQNFMEGIITDDWEIGLWVWSRNETSVFTLELSKIEESTSSVFQSKIHTNFFFLKHRRDGPLWLYPQRSNGESTLFYWSSEVTETRCLLQEAKELGISCGLCIMTMHPCAQLIQFTFLVKLAFLWFRNCPAPLIWLPTTSGCFPKLKWL